jgi:hypothetical protein
MFWPQDLLHNSFMEIHLKCTVLLLCELISKLSYLQADFRLGGGGGGVGWVLAPWRLGFPRAVSSGILLFSIVTNDICGSVCNVTCLLCADCFKIFRCIINVEDCKLLQSHIGCVHKWCLDNGMNFSVDKSTFIFFTRRTNSIACKHKIGFTNSPPPPVR